MRSVTTWGRRTAAVLTLGLAAAATGAVPAQAADGPAARYIVVLKDGTVSAQSVAGDAAVTATYSSLPAFAANLTPRAARALAGDPAVSFVEPDRYVRIAKATWGLDRIDQRSVTPSGTFTPMDDGSSVHAYVIDTGIRMTHAQFGGRAVSGYDFVDRDTYAGDCNGHGTHVAGTIGGSTYGVAKKVSLVAVRVLDCEGGGYVSTILRGIDWVTRTAIKPAVVNMSLGADADRAVDAAVAASIRSGITYVVAAGNENRNAAYDSPARVGAAITVGATDARDRRASFSNWGSRVDLFAPGVNITSAWKNSNTSVGTISGTSMAAPHVTGAAALVLDAYPSFTPAQVQSWLVARATTGRVTDPRTGSPNRLLYVPPPPARPVVATASLPAAVTGSAYTARLSLAAARTGSWSLISGSLPDGLTLSAAGVLSGTPTAAGSAVFKVRFTDFVPQTGDKWFKLTVS